MATVDYFLKIDGIAGESRDDKQKDEIEIESFSWGETQTGSFAVGGGAGAGKVSIQDFYFTMRGALPSAEERAEMRALDAKLDALAAKLKA